MDVVQRGKPLVTFLFYLPSLPSNEISVQGQAILSHSIHLLSPSAVQGWSLVMWANFLVAPCVMGGGLITVFFCVWNILFVK